jgi:hypothetical protein
VSILFYDRPLKHGAAVPPKEADAAFFVLIPNQIAMHYQADFA